MAEIFFKSSGSLLYILRGIENKKGLSTTENKSQWKPDKSLFNVMSYNEEHSNYPLEGHIIKWLNAVI